MPAARLYILYGYPHHGARRHWALFITDGVNPHTLGVRSHAVTSGNGLGHNMAYEEDTNFNITLSHTYSVDRMALDVELLPDRTLEEAMKVIREFPTPIQRWVKEMGEYHPDCQDWCGDVIRALESAKIIPAGVSQHLAEIPSRD